MSQEDLLPIKVSKNLEKMQKNATEWCSTANQTTSTEPYLTQSGEHDVDNSIRIGSIEAELLGVECNSVVCFALTQDSYNALH